MGLIGKIQILEELKKANPTIEYSSLFITILFIAIDSVPITLKLLCKYSPYDAYIETQEENAIYLTSKELSDIERKNNEIINSKKIDKLSDTILSITVKIPNDKELTGLAEYNSIRNEILQKILQENQKKVLEVLTTNRENQNGGKIPVMANNNGNGQQKSQLLNNIST
ncbi:MAG: DUF4407 domain-containing protein [Nostoc sp.]|uniref:DUF4407 domain-containing protein n=1 Tax=Nostoc sp. TaxID=1180 RepID=UPI002FFA1AEA